MRHDMFHVIIDRPRSRSQDGNEYKGEVKARQKAQLCEEHPKRESTARRRRKDHKELNEHLGPLRRFLLSKVGQNWNKVYKEVREHIDPKDQVQQHVIDHLLQYVERDVIMVSKGKFTDSRGDTISDPFFVHPKTGNLVKNEESYWFRKSNYEDNRPPKYIKKENRTFFFLDGIWYEAELKEMPPIPAPIETKVPHTYGKGTWIRKDNRHGTCPYPACPDMIHGGQLLTYGEALKFYGAFVYAANKLQVNGKVIKRFGLHEEEAKFVAKPK